MMKVKREGSGTLCDTCRRGQVMTTDLGQFIVICQSGGEDKVLRSRIVDCSKYADKRKPALYEMEEHAWLLVTEARHGQTVGFISPKQRKKDGKELADY